MQIQLITNYQIPPLIYILLSYYLFELNKIYLKQSKKQKIELSIKILIENNNKNRINYLLLLLFVVIEIAPEPISKINPIVKTTKKIKAILNPKVLTLYKVTAIGNNNNISKSKIKNNIATT